MTKLQIAISFDTTGSMSRALNEVRKRITEMIRLLKKDIPGVTLSIIAHGDYCDADIYVTKHIDFTDDERALVSFVQDVKDTGGGDTPECYELVLRLVRTELSWKKASQKILVVIGDSYPHPPEDPQNKDSIDWEQEARLLAGMPMRIYGAQINNDRQSTEFFQKLTQMTGGSHLKLTEPSVLSDVIMAVCYRTKSTRDLKTWETEVRAQYAPEPLHKDLEEIFAVLHEPLPVATVPALKKAKRSPYVYRGKDVSFFWGGQMTPSQPLNWEPPGEEEDEEEEENSVHKLQLKQAVLGSEAKAHEANIVEMETTNFRDEKVVQPIVYMIGAKDSMMAVDLSFNSPVTFRLVSGSGPVYLAGQHVARALQEEDEEGEASGASIDKVTVESSRSTSGGATEKSSRSTYGYAAEKSSGSTYGYATERSSGSRYGYAAEKSSGSTYGYAADKSSLSTSEDAAEKSSGPTYGYATEKSSRSTSEDVADKSSRSTSEDVADKNSRSTSEDVADESFQSTCEDAAFGSSTAVDSAVSDEEAGATSYDPREEDSRASMDTPGDARMERSDDFERNLRSTLGAVSRLYGTAHTSSSESKPSDCKTS